MPGAGREKAFDYRRDPFGPSPLNHLKDFAQPKWSGVQRQLQPLPPMKTEIFVT